jgi:hypothetical protein
MVHYQGRSGHRSPAYHCPNSELAEGRGLWCLRVGGTQIDQAVAGALLAALTPAGVKAALVAAESLEADHDAALAQWRLQLERAQYHADRAERRYRQAEPEHRLVARGLERDWENALTALGAPHRPSSSCASISVPAPSPLQSAKDCSRSALTSGACGPLRRRPTATANSCCAR